MSGIQVVKNIMEQRMTSFLGKHTDRNIACGAYTTKVLQCSCKLIKQVRTSQLFFNLGCSCALEQ